MFCYSRLFLRDTPKAKATVCLTRHWACDHGEEVKPAQNCAFLSSYAAIIGSSSPTFRNNLSHLRGPLEDGRGMCLETSVRNYHHSLRNNPEECGSHLLLGGSPENMALHNCLFLLVNGIHFESSRMVTPSCQRIKLITQNLTVFRVLQHSVRGYTSRTGLHVILQPLQ